MRLYHGSHVGKGVQENPFIYAFRRGGDLKNGPYQCIDCGETVMFNIGKDLWLVIGAVKDIATVWKPYLFML